jgi:hypothetical protein
MDLLLYGSEHEAALRAAKRLGSGEVALVKARIVIYRKPSNTRALLEAVPPELHNDTGYIRVTRSRGARLFSSVRTFRADHGPDSR